MVAGSSPARPNSAGDEAYALGEEFEWSIDSLFGKRSW